MSSKRGALDLVLDIFRYCACGGEPFPLRLYRVEIDSVVTEHPAVYERAVAVLKAEYGTEVLIVLELCRYSIDCSAGSGSSSSGVLPKGKIERFVLGHADLSR